MNGQIIGVHKRPDFFVKAFRRLRRKGLIGEFVSVFLDEKRKAINIASDYGRLSRPLIIIEDGVPKVNNYHIELLVSKMILSLFKHSSYRKEEL